MGAATAGPPARHQAMGMRRRRKTSERGWQSLSPDIFGTEVRATDKRCCLLRACCRRRDAAADGEADLLDEKKSAEVRVDTEQQQQRAADLNQHQHAADGAQPAPACCCRHAQEALHASMYALVKEKSADPWQMTAIKVRCSMQAACGTPPGMSPHGLCVRFTADCDGGAGASPYPL